MRTYRKITILFADEEPAMSYADEALAQSVLQRCEEWREKLSVISENFRQGLHDYVAHGDKCEAHFAAHPLEPSYGNAEDYALKTVLLCE
jgi:hypothetical protein